MTIMKEITYKDRAKFYYDETYSDVDHEFLKNTISRYSIKSILDIPCGAGRNLKMLAKNCDFAVFCDIEKNMVDQIQMEIEKNKYNNCQSFCSDILDFKLKNKVDMTIVMRQALQLFSPGKMYRIIDNLLLNTSKIIILDLYCFSEHNKKGQVPEYLKNTNKEFLFNNNKVIRTLSLEKKIEGTLVKYNYKLEKEEWTTQFKLFDINPKLIREYLISKKVRKIIEYRDYFFNVRENENSIIFVIEI